MSPFCQQVAAESPKTLAQYLSENQTTLPEMLFNQRAAGEVNSSSRIIIPYFLAVEIEGKFLVMTFFQFLVLLMNI
jgi:hypothetical protein